MQSVRNERNTYFNCRLFALCLFSPATFASVDVLWRIILSLMPSTNHMRERRRVTELLGGGNSVRFNKEAVLILGNKRN